MRHNTLEGQELYEPKSDSVLIQTIIENVNDNVGVIVIPHNLDTPEFGVKAAHYIVDEMKKQGKLPQDFGEKLKKEDLRIWIRKHMKSQKNLLLPVKELIIEEYRLVVGET